MCIFVQFFGYRSHQSTNKGDKENVNIRL